MNKIGLVDLRLHPKGNNKLLLIALAVVLVFCLIPVIAIQNAFGFATDGVQPVEQTANEAELDENSNAVVADEDLTKETISDDVDDASFKENATNEKSDNDVIENYCEGGALEADSTANVNYKPSHMTFAFPRELNQYLRTDTEKDYGIRFFPGGSGDAVQLSKLEGKAFIKGAVIYDVWQLANEVTPSSDAAQFRTYLKVGTNKTAKVKNSNPDYWPTSSDNKIAVPDSIDDLKAGSQNTTFTWENYADPEFYAVFNTAAEGGKVANTISFYYDSCKASHSASTETVYGNLPIAATQKTDWGYDEKRSSVSNVVIDASVSYYHGLTSTAFMFDGMKDASNISGCEYLDVSNVTNMQKMFYNYAADSTNITDVPDVSDWNTGNVTNMASLFGFYADSSTSITAVPDVSGWDTGNVTSMAGLFTCYGYVSTSITAVPDVSAWNTGNVTSMAGLFSSYAASSTSITAVPNVSKWKTGNVTSMMNMFYQYASESTAKLQALDLSKWSISSLTDARTMFSNYAAKNTQGDPVVYATDWSTTKETGVSAQNMFVYSKLKGSITGGWASANTSDTGCFTAKPYTVTFDMQGHGTQVDPQTVVQGAKVEKPNDPSAEGYEFGGWYKEAACTNAWDFDNDTVQADTTLYAMWTGGTTYTVTFNMQGHGTQVDPQTVVQGAKVEKPDNPSAEGYKFGGWHKEAACTNAWDFDNDTVQADTTLYAKWTPKTAQVISFSKSSVTKTYGDSPFTNVLSGAKTSPVAYESLHTDVATVDTDGQVTILKAGTATIKATAPEDETYASATASYALTVDAKTLTVSGATVQDKVYDGSTTAQMGTEGTLEGIIGTDDVSIDKVTATFKDANVGDDKPVTANYTLKGIKAENYLVAEVTDLSANITAKELTVGGAEVNNKVYDGTTDSSMKSNGSLVGIVATDDVSIDKVTATFEDANIGDDKPVTANYTLKGTKAGNYTVTNPTGLTANITKRSITLTSADATKVYDGTALTDNNVTVSEPGFVEGQGATYNVTGSQTNVGSSPNSFDYTLNEGTQSGNYDITTACGTLTVTPGDISTAVISNIDPQIYTGEEIKPEPSVTLGTETLIKDTDYTLLYENNVDAGTAKVKVEGKGNYAGAKDVAFTITKRQVTLTSDSATKAYDGDALTAENVTVSGEGFIEGQGATYNVRGSQTEVGVSDNSFDYTLNEGTKAGNYDIKTVYGALEVTSAPGSDVKINTEELKKIREQYQKENPGFEVSVNMEVTPGKADEKDVAKIQAEAGDKKLWSTDAKLVVKVDGTEVADAGDVNDVLVAIQYNLDFNKKADFQTYRVHNDVLAELTETPNSDGEFVKYDSQADTVTITAKKYSTYSVAYNEVATPTPDNPSRESGNLSSSSKTGDNSSFAAFGLLSIMVVAAGAGVIIRRKAIK